ncbi:LacI family transcriptional regulator [Kribbella turkmenica]|uniref:LacI family transcriptional regulator n=1 Tax=Kribbella turkmenica TaxID=2530375 RepID=A0A4R4WS36_9ACTN|nr:LacI family DNA-binding transcriptional regulator [Kribbella turkmenica]TDD20070.1 LacI family transcriptional regulator [Kribbella turkmenica]
MVTLREVAAAAGVSIKTASNVVNGISRVSPALRERVERAVAELDYRPNVAARNLRRGRTGLVALGVPSLRNPYFAELADLIVEAAERQGLTVLVDSTRGSRSRERLVLDGFGMQLVDGLILCPHGLSNEDLVDRRDRTPLVLLGERDIAAGDNISIDSYEVAFTATRHLLDGGRRRIGVVGFEASVSSDDMARRRIAGYRAALAEAGLEYDAGLVRMMGRGHRADDAGEAAQQLLSERADLDALFCFNDEFALGVMRRLVAAGVKIPDDAAVIGIDDVDAGRLFSPSLSTVSPDKLMIAERAIAMLLNRIGGDDAAPRREMAGFRLIARESTGG